MVRWEHAYLKFGQLFLLLDISVLIGLLVALVHLCKFLIGRGAQFLLLIAYVTGRKKWDQTARVTLCLLVRLARFWASQATRTVRGGARGAQTRRHRLLFWSGRWIFPVFRKQVRSGIFRCRCHFSSEFSFYLRCFVWFLKIYISLCWVVV